MSETELLELEERMAQLRVERRFWRVGELVATIHARQLWKTASGSWGSYLKLRNYGSKALEEKAIWENFTEAEYESYGRAGCLKRLRDARRLAREGKAPEPAALVQPEPVPPPRAVACTPNGKRSMKDLLLGLRAGEVKFDEFARSARKDIRALAASLIRCWHVPASISAEDLEQEMLLAAWQAVERWDPNKASINGFVVFNMCDRAKKAIHKERAALRRDGKAQSRHAVPLSTLTEDGSLPEFAKTLWSEDHTDDMPVLLGVPRERVFALQSMNQLRFELQRNHPQHDRAIAALFDCGLEKDRAARLLYSWGRDEWTCGDPGSEVPSLGMARRVVKAAAALCGLEVR